jgi:hypothetical protein
MEKEEKGRKEKEGRQKLRSLELCRHGKEPSEGGIADSLTWSWGLCLGDNSAHCILDGGEIDETTTRL